ncbi:hypothetical protein EHI44_16700 [Rhizobium leguminosarum]|uniref:hypothetical protein n=1 Tax=Rhizobium leguminosarum TaxID=384 RepID=UPI000FEDBECB|nr:hypothetical protein [Rhizobium leguminosarum]RWY85154.1 hypothetical protein EHI44_16700 [Rhizobium leguminosarum]
MVHELARNCFPENLSSLHAGEEEVRRRSIEFIEGDAELLLHLNMIERVMDLLQFIRQDYGEITDGQLIVKLLGARLFNDMGAAIRLALGGYYQAAGSHIRDMLETSFLLDYFSTDHALILSWKSADEGIRNKEFNQAKIRKALDERDGFTEAKRYEHYKLLSSVASHPTFDGFGMLRPQAGADAHMGPFFVKGLLSATAQELVKVAVISSGCFRQFFKPSNVVQYRASIAHLESISHWSGAVFGKALDQRQFHELRELLTAIEADGP